MDNWESLIASRIEAHHETRKSCAIVDPVKRNSVRATKAWRIRNAEHFKAKKKEWEKANPEKIKMYLEHNKENVKRWAEEHHDRIRELGRKYDNARKNDPKRQAWIKAYRSTEEYKEKSRERDRKRNQTPERKAWFRERGRRRAEARRIAKEVA